MLEDRAALLAASRAFFAKRGVLEVDVPALSPYGSVDPHIDLIEVRSMGRRGFLHSSPEYGMKRLLAAGIGDIYQLSHVFRDLESGERHNLEFTMVEWYRLGFTLEQMIEETLDFVRLFVGGDRSFEKITFKEAFGGDYPEDREVRDRLFALEIEPHLLSTVVTDFPPDQAALAQIEGGVAKRFEVFYAGMELANGYLELTDAAEWRARLDNANQERRALGKAPYPIDPHLRDISACSGVAVGFDRLMMLRHGVQDIHEILPC